MRTMLASEKRSPSHLQSLKRAACFVLMVALCPLAMAQPLDRSGERRPSVQDLDPGYRADMEERINQKRQALRPEYELRVKRDGQHQATQWLQREAEEIGREEGVRARKHLAASQGKQSKGQSNKRTRNGRDSGCAHVITRNRSVPNLASGGMDMMLVTECVPSPRRK